MNQENFSEAEDGLKLQIEGAVTFLLRKQLILFFACVFSVILCQMQSTETSTCYEHFCLTTSSPEALTLIGTLIAF